MKKIIYIKSRYRIILIIILVVFTSFFSFKLIYERYVTKIFTEIDVFSNGAEIGKNASVDFAVKIRRKLFCNKVELKFYEVKINFALPVPEEAIEFKREIAELESVKKFVKENPFVNGLSFSREYNQNLFDLKNEIDLNEKKLKFYYDYPDYSSGNTLIYDSNIGLILYLTYKIDIDDSSDMDTIEVLWHKKNNGGFITSSETYHCDLSPVYNFIYNIR